MLPLCDNHNVAHTQKHRKKVGGRKDENEKESQALMDALPHRSLVNPSKLVSSRIGIFEGVGTLKQDSGR